MGNFSEDGHPVSFREGGKGLLFSLAGSGADKERDPVERTSQVTGATRGQLLGHLLGEGGVGLEKQFKLQQSRFLF